MTAPSTTRSGVGFRYCNIFGLDANGYPAAGAVPATAYEGLLLSGAKTLTITDPEPRRIVHVGDDAPFALDVLPPNEAMSGELTISKRNDAVEAAITGKLSFAVGEYKFMAFGDDKRGFEAQVGLMAYRQSLDTDPVSSNFGKRIWELKIFPKVILVPRESGFDENPEARLYTVVPQFVTKHLWGTAVAAGTEGVTRAQGFGGVSEYHPKLVAWLADGTEDEFLFPTTAPAQATGKIVAWNNGVIVSTGMTPSVTKLTFTVAPIVAHVIVALYEVA